MTDVFRLDRPTAFYNAGLWFLVAGVAAAVAFVVREWWPIVAIVIGVLAAVAIVVGIVMAVRPPWVVRIDDHLSVRGKQSARLPLADIRDVRWVAGELVVRSEKEQVKIPMVDDRNELAKSLRARLEMK